jgi:two-component system chemotaxis response regulator CheY
MKRPLTPVLVVDDQDVTLTVITKILESLGIEDVATACDGSEALGRLQARPFGLVISDWHMKAMGGLQLLRHVRTNVRFAGIPFIIITGDAQVDVVLSARQAGADAVILKPFTMEALRKKLHDVVKQKPNYAPPVMPRPDWATSFLSHDQEELRVA